MRALAVALAVTLAACSSAAPAPGAPAGGATGGKRDEASRIAPGRQLYQRGKPYTPTRPGDDRYTCQGSPADEEACQAVRGPGYHCVLESPVGYWEGEIRCSGVRMRDEDLQKDRDRVDRLTIPLCVCGCTDEYARAADAFRQRLEECAEVP